MFFADFFFSVGLGLGGTDTPQQKMRKSISNERTFSATNDESILFQKLGKYGFDLFFISLILIAIFCFFFISGFDYMNTL